MARDDRDLLRAMLRCSLDAWTQVRRLAEEIGFFGFSRDYWRWGEDFVAPRAEWRVPVDSWVSGEGVWKLELGSGGLWRELADEVNFG